MDGTMPVVRHPTCGLAGVLELAPSASLCMLLYGCNSPGFPPAYVFQASAERFTDVVLRRQLAMP